MKTLRFLVLNIVKKKNEKRKIICSIQSFNFYYINSHESPSHSPTPMEFHSLIFLIIINLLFMRYFYF